MRKRLAALKSCSRFALLALHGESATLMPVPLVALCGSGGLCFMFGWWSIHTDPKSDTECKPASVARAMRCRTARRSALLSHAPRPRLEGGAVASVGATSRIEKTLPGTFLAQAAGC